MGDVYHYDVTYVDIAGSYRAVKVIYNHVLDRYDYTSDSYNNDGQLTYQAKQQFCKSGDGYYYQALRHSLLDEMERASFSYFDDKVYTVYVKPNSEGIDYQNFVIDIYDEEPKGHEALVEGLGDLTYLKRSSLGFSYN